MQARVPVITRLARVCSIRHLPCGPVLVVTENSRRYAQLCNGDRQDSTDHHLAEASCYKPEGRGFPSQSDNSMCQLDLIHSAHHNPAVTSTTKRDE